MSPAFVPSIKELVRTTTLATANLVAQRILKMNTLGEVRGFLTRKIRQICPNISLLDVRR
jgi:hypothetical protein